MNASRPDSASGASPLADQLWPSPEQQLLLEAALMDGDRARAAYRSWRARCDLEGEFGMAALGLLPLVYRNLQRLGVDDPLMGRLKGVYRRVWYENHQLFHRARPIVSRLVDDGVDVLLLKGAPLVLSYYRHHALRPMADLDIAVPFASAPDAVALLAAGGLRPSLDATDETFRYRHAMQLLGDDGLEVDLHWRVLFEAAHDAGDAFFWSSSEALDFMGIPVRQLDPTRLLLHVIVHGIRMNEATPVRWIPDALTVLRARGCEIDWDGLVAFATRERFAYRLLLGLSYLVRVFGAAVPVSALSRLRDRSLTLVERIENTVALRKPGSVSQTVWGNQWAILVDYCRLAETRDPLRFVAGFSHYVRYRWSLGGRREVLPAVARAVWRRMAADGDRVSRLPQ